MSTPAERITADQLDWARRESEGSCRLCDSPELLRLLLAERAAVLADNERLTAEAQELADWDKADQRRRALQDERDRAVTLWHEQHKELERLRQELAAAGGSPLRRCAIDQPHSSHLWTADSECCRCLGIEGDQPMTVAEVERNQLRQELAEMRDKLAAAITEAEWRGFVLWSTSGQPPAAADHCCLHEARREDCPWCAMGPGGAPSAVADHDAIEAA